MVQMRQWMSLSSNNDNPLPHLPLNEHLSHRQLSPAAIHLCLFLRARNTHKGETHQQQGRHTTATRPPPQTNKKGGRNKQSNGTKSNADEVRIERCVGAMNEDIREAMG